MLIQISVDTSATAITLATMALNVNILFRLVQALIVDQAAAWIYRLANPYASVVLVSFFYQKLFDSLTENVIHVLIKQVIMGLTVRPHWMFAQATLVWIRDHAFQATTNGPANACQVIKKYSKNKTVKINVILPLKS